MVGFLFLLVQLILLVHMQGENPSAYVAHDKRRISLARSHDCGVKLQQVANNLLLHFLPLSPPLFSSLTSPLTLFIVRGGGICGLSRARQVFYLWALFFLFILRQNPIYPGWPPCAILLPQLSK